MNQEIVNWVLFGQLILKKLVFVVLHFVWSTVLQLNKIPVGIGGKIFAKGFVLRAKRFIGGGISINVSLCDIFVWTCYLNIDLRIHHARISSSFYIRYIELNELRTSQAAFRGGCTSRLFGIWAALSIPIQRISSLQWHFSCHTLSSKVQWHMGGLRN